MLRAQSYFKGWRAGRLLEALRLNARQLVLVKGELAVSGEFRFEHHHEGEDVAELVNDSRVLLVAWQGQI